MEKRGWPDVLKLIGTATIVVGCGLALLFLFDEELHLSRRWRLFALGHVFAFFMFLWYVRPLLKQLKPCRIVLASLIGHTAVAFALMKSRLPVLYILGALPFEAYVIIEVAKKFMAPVPRKEPLLPLL